MEGIRTAKVSVSLTSEVRDQTGLGLTVPFLLLLPVQIEQVTLDRDGVRQPEGDLYLTPFHLVLQAADLSDYQVPRSCLSLPAKSSSR